MRNNHTFGNGFHKISSLLLAAVLFASTFFVLPYTYASDLVDSGIDYSDGRETVTVNGKTEDALFRNPYRGFHNWPINLTLKNSDSNTAVDSASKTASKECTLSYFPVELSDFSGAYHLEGGNRGPDAELTPSALEALDLTLKNFKKNNNQVIIRFVYDKNNDGIQAGEGWTNSSNSRYVEPRQDMVIRHIEQLGPILNANADTILTVQIGFYGAYGELHSTASCTKSNINGALTKMLEVTRDSGLSVSVRTPTRYAYYKDVEIGNIESAVSVEGEDAYRIAIFNDGYLGSDSDTGTFINRKKETNWMATQNLHNPYGGDAIPGYNSEGAFIADQAKPPFVLNEMFKVHTSYISPDHRLKEHWRNTSYDEIQFGNEYQYDVPDSDYVDATLYEYIENHLGYRFVLRDSKLSGSVKSGGTLSSTFEIENVGFGNLFYPMESAAYIVSENGDVVAGPIDVDVNPANYHTRTKTADSMSINIPNNLASGEYKLYLQFKIGDREDGSATPYGAVRFANSGVWNPVLGANYLGSFTVDREVTITKKWEDDGDASLRPGSLSFTLEDIPRLPEEYQEVEYIESDGDQWIDTGVTANAAHSIYYDGYLKDSFGPLMCAFSDSSNRFGMKFLTVSNKIGYYWRLGGTGAKYSEIAELNGISLKKRFQVTQNSEGLNLNQEDKSLSESYAGAISGSGAGNWQIMHHQDEGNAMGVLYEAKISEQGQIIHHYVPCYRKSDKEIGLYDLIDGDFLTNTGSGTFEKGSDVTTTSETMTIAKDKWTVQGSTWVTKLKLNEYRGNILIYEADVNHYKSDATVDNKKTIDSNNAVSITNTLKTSKPDPSDPTKPQDPETELYTITYKLNGGILDGETGPIERKYEAGTVIRLPKPSREGFRFDYWEGSRYDAYEEYIVTSDHTFTAVWTKASSVKSAKTGDDNHLYFWVFAMFAAVTMLVAMRKLFRSR